MTGGERSVYRRKDGRWVAQYRDARGKVRYVYRKSRGEAKKAQREALADRDEGVFYLCSLVGLRIGEALRYEDVDLERGTIRVERTLHEGECSAPKTSCSRCTLSLPQRALEALVRHCGGRNNPTTGYLFATASGKPVDLSNFYRWSWRPALRRAGLPETLTPHQLRHGAASLLLNQNVPVPVVSRYLGHANPGVPMKVYAHMIDGTSGMAADGIDEALG
jgi:integrase